MADNERHIPYEQLVSYALDQVKPALANAIGEHLIVCPECRATVTQLRRLGDQLRVSESERPSAEVLARVEAVARPRRLGPRASAYPLQAFLGRALLIIFSALAIGGAWTLVNQSQAALPGDGLYIVKRAAETADLDSTLSDVGRAQIHVNLVRSRLHDIVALTVAGRYEDIPPAVEAFRSEIDQTAVSLRVVAGQDQPSGVLFVEQVEQSLNYGAQQLSALALAGPLNAQPILQSAIEASVAGKNVMRAQLPVAARMALDSTSPQPTLAPLAVTALASSTWSATLATRVTETATPGATASRTPTPTASGVPESSPTTAPTVTERPTSAASATMTASATSRPTETVIPSATPSYTPPATETATQAATPTASTTASPQPSATDTLEPTSTATPLPTSTFTAEPTNTDTAIPTNTDTATPTATDTLTPTDTETPVPTETPLPTDTDTPVPTDTPADVPVSPTILMPFPSGTPMPTDLPPATDTPEPTQ